jgi:hypothetical protein
MAASSESANPENAMTQLLARYIGGEIRETHWSRFVEVIDSGELSSDDRRAFAAFFADILDETGDGDIHLPIVSEVGEVGNDTFRAAA